MTSDLDLLGRFVQEKSQDAFTTLVNRHVNLVYSAALRQVRSPQLAEEIAQSVFTDLARDAGKISGTGVPPVSSLTPWLYAVTRRTAIDMIRKESRRQLREQVAYEMNAMNATTNDWSQIEPLLDDAMAALDETDRSAILLRYFENKNLREVGEALGTSDDTAQKRVSRAVERLREFFSKRNVTIGTTGLTAVITANAVSAAPVGLTVTISAAVLTGTTIATTSTIIATTKTIAMTTFQKTVITAAFVAAAGAGIFEAHQAVQLRGQNQTLQQQQATLANKNQQLQQQFDEATNRLAGLLMENTRLESNSNRMELLKLRGEVTQLRQSNAKADENDGRESFVKSWLAREDQLKQFVQQYPDKAIPEFQLLSEDEWLGAAMNAKFDTDKDVQKELANLRHSAENNFATRAHDAISKYLKANNGQFPADISQLQPYFSPPMDNAILQRWEVAPASANPSVGVGNPIITEKAAVDESLDQRWAIGATGYGSGNWEPSDISDALATIKPAMKAYAADHGGSQPTDPSQIRSYLITPEQQATFQIMMQKYPTNPATHKAW